MKSCFVMHNTGLGDYILMSGAVRHLLSLYEEVHLVAAKSKLENVEILYRDEPRIVLLPEPDARSSQQGQRKVKVIGSRYRKHGYDVKAFFWSYMGHWPDLINKSGMDNTVNNWCEAFYNNLGVDYSERYNSFYFERDLEREDRLYRKVVDEFGSVYSFVVDHQRTKKQDLLIHDTRIVNPKYWKEDTLIFDWMKVIEKADIIHTIDTAYMHLIKQMRLNGDDRLKFFHRYARDCPGTNGGYINDNWDDGWIDRRDREKIICLEE